jgi:CDP-diacylglycerol--serine O-phosphatidyltransferase
MKRMEKVQRRLEQRRGIHLLPNLLTTCSLYAGFYSIIASINGNFFHAAVAIVVSAFFDTLDGRVARMTGTTSAFGVQYDSLSDLVAFGVAPAVLAYLWALQPFGHLGWVVGFLYMACGALRLARFNASVVSRKSGFFQGLPIPAAAGMIAATVFFFDYLGWSGLIRDWIIISLVITLSFFMVSNFRYFALKGELPRRQQFNALVAAILILALISVRPQVVLFFIGLSYIVSGPIMTLHFARSLGGKKEDELETPASEKELL